MAKILVHFTYVKFFSFIFVQVYGINEFFKSFLELVSL